ncbi:MAG: transcription elongation factor GreA, partial [Clostridia bacterium]|nr:transcription elongation factor GreA [Clostridia bacterium]
MAEIKFYTPEGFRALQEELDYLVTVRVEENKKEISTARSFGDLSENSEYDEAKAEQGKIHSRIAELREMIANAKVLDESEIDKSRVSVGSIVRVFNETRGME